MEVNLRWKWFDYSSNMATTTNLNENRFLKILQYCLQLEPPRDKTNKVTVRPAKTQISLGIRPVWTESSLCA